MADINIEKAQAEVKQEIQSLSIGSVGVQDSSINENVIVNTNPQLVKVICKYPKDFKEEKYLVEGKEYFIGAENAKLFVDVKKIAVYAK